jgi:uncharacterized membrane protein
MTNLVIAAVFLPLSHFLIASTRLRDWLIGRLGEKRYFRLYSWIAYGAVAWLLFAYYAAPSVPLWHVPRALRLALAPVILFATLLAVAGITTPNPVIVRSERLFNTPEVVCGILRISRNPFFWGMALFALAHVIIIGDIAATLAFGSVALLGFAGAPVLDAKKARRHGEAWRAFAAVTSDIPFLAIAKRRQRFAWREIGWRRFAYSLALFGLALLFHHPGVSGLGHF